MRKLIRYTMSTTLAEKCELLRYALRSYLARSRWDNTLCAAVICAIAAWLFARHETPLSENAVASQPKSTPKKRAEPRYRRVFPDGTVHWYNAFGVPK